MATPSQCIVSYAVVSTLATFLACLLSAVVLLLSPEEPWRLGYDGGAAALYPAVGLLLTSALSVVACLLGCWAVARDSKALLGAFAVWVIVLAALMLASSGTFFGLTYSFQVRDHLSGQLTHQIQAYNSSNSPLTIDRLQQEYHCCGAYNYTDWNESGIVTPTSCCHQEYANCSSSSDQLYTQGCLNLLVKRLKAVGDAILAATVVAALLLVAAAVVSSYGASLIHKYEDYDVI